MVEIKNYSCPRCHSPVWYDPGTKEYICIKEMHNQLEDPECAKFLAFALKNNLHIEEKHLKKLK
jgi:hypothetical protein